jgi:hypothetical protein
LLPKSAQEISRFRRCIALTPAANATTNLTYEALHPTASVHSSLSRRLNSVVVLARRFYRGHAKLYRDMEISEQDYVELHRLEEELWQEATRFNLHYMEQILADDFFEFGRSGRIHQRQDILNMPAGPIEAVLPLPDFHIRLLDSDTAHVTYKSAVTHNGITEYANRSSIWSRTIDGWKLRFHQGTTTSG